MRAIDVLIRESEEAEEEETGNDDIAESDLEKVDDARTGVSVPYGVQEDEKESVSRSPISLRSRLLGSWRSTKTDLYRRLSSANEGL